MLQPSALISVSDFKDWIGLVDDTSAQGELVDSLIEGWINSVSDQIEAWCGRVFRKGTLVDEAHDGNGLGFFRVYRPPITSFTSLKVDDVTLESTAYTWKDSGLVQLVSSASGVLVLSSQRFPAGVKNVLASYVGGYVVIPQPVKEAAKIAVASLWYRRAGDPNRAGESAAGFAKSRGTPHSSGLPGDAIELLQRYKLLRIARAGVSGPESTWS